MQGHDRLEGPFPLIISSLQERGVGPKNKKGLSEDKTHGAHKKKKVRSGRNPGLIAI